MDAEMDVLIGKVVGVVLLSSMAAVLAVSAVCWLVKTYPLVVAAGGFLLGLVLFGFGLINWYDSARPTNPTFYGHLEGEKLKQAIELWEKQQVEVGQRAVVPLVYAVPLTLLGLGVSGLSIGAVVRVTANKR